MPAFDGPEEPASFHATLSEQRVFFFVMPAEERERRSSVAAEAAGSESEEEDADLMIRGDQFSGAWDFPLSRAEKVRRLIQLFENELPFAPLGQGLPGPGVPAEIDDDEVEEALSAPDTQASTAEQEPMASARPAGGRLRVEELFPATDRQVPMASIFLSEPCQGTGTSSSSNSSSWRATGALASSPDAQLAHHPPITGVRWSGGNLVRSISFVQDQSWQEHLGSEEGLGLLGGEHIRAVRGRCALRDGHLAEWLQLVTSTLRVLTLGRPPSRASPPTFSFLAVKGHEICGIRPGVTGSVESVEQRPIVPSRGSGWTAVAAATGRCAGEPPAVAQPEKEAAESPPPRAAPMVGFGPIGPGLCRSQGPGKQRASGGRSTSQRIFQLHSLIAGAR